MPRGRTDQKVTDLVPLEELPEEARKYAGNGYNLLLPTLSFKAISPHHSISWQVVRIDPDPDKGDVWTVKKHKVGNEWVPEAVALAKPALERLAMALGISWHPTLSGPMLSPNPDLAIARAVGIIRRPDGSYDVIPKHYTLDLVEEEKALYELNRKKAASYRPPRDEEWVKAQVESAMIQKRRFRHRLAETGAMLRVIRSCVGVRPHYSPEELAKPVVVPRVEFTPDLSDEDVKHELFARALQAEQVLFGGVLGSAVASAPVIQQVAAPALEAPVTLEPAGEEAEVEEPEKKRADLLEELFEILADKRLFTDDERAKIQAVVTQPNCELDRIENGIEWAKAEAEARDEVSRRRCRGREVRRHDPDRTLRRCPPGRDDS
jgi:hypothetical protein